MKQNLTFTQRYSYSIIIGVVFFIVAFLFFSCSARTSKTDKSKVDSTATVKIEVTEKSSETVKQVVKSDSTSTKKKETIVNIFEDALELEPIDANKESSFTDSNGNTKTFKNVRIRTNKIKDNSIVYESENVRKIEEKDTEIATLKDVVSQLTSEISVLKEEKSKLIVKPQFNWSTFILQLWWLWLLILVALFLAYKYYNGITPISLIQSVYENIKPKQRKEA
jgi:hypothetical protein